MASLPSAGRIRNQIYPTARVQCDDLKPEHPSSSYGILVIPTGSPGWSSAVCQPDSQMPVNSLSSPHTSFHNCQHQQCFVVSCNNRKPQAYESAGLIVSPQVTVSVYANTLIHSTNLSSCISFTVRSRICSLKAKKLMQVEE